MREIQNGVYNVRYFWLPTPPPFLLEWLLIYRHSKSLLIWIEGNEYCKSNKHSDKTLFGILLSNDHASRWNWLFITSIKDKPFTTNLYFFYKIRRLKSKEWAKFKLECLLLIFIYSNFKFEAVCKNADLQCH